MDTSHPALHRAVSQLQGLILPEILTLADLAEFAKVDASLLEGEAQKGCLRTVQLSDGTHLVHRSSLKAWLSGQSAAAR